jgi:arginine decarboxylase-like protein
VVGEGGRFHIQKLVPGSTVREMVATAGFSPDELQEKFRVQLRAAVSRGRLTEDEATQLVQAYLNRATEPTYLDT